MSAHSWVFWATSVHHLFWISLSLCWIVLQAWQQQVYNFSYANVLPISIKNTWFPHFFLLPLALLLLAPGPDPESNSLLKCGLCSVTKPWTCDLSWIVFYQKNLAVYTTFAGFMRPEVVNNCYLLLIRVLGFREILCAQNLTSFKYNYDLQIKRYEILTQRTLLFFYFTCGWLS